MGRAKAASKVVRSDGAATRMDAGPLTGSDVCATRDACLLAYRLHVDALALTEVAKQQVAARDAGNAGKLLISAEQKLNEAGVRVADCTGREAALRHRYKL